ncbi:MAG: hypothetical protein C5S47_07615 [Candidatus Methanogasteraceae archaeon]|nr:MAG: hypothetical protein C5S47_07615 [ANME-2 cluster archaeon]
MRRIGTALGMLLGNCICGRADDRGWLAGEEVAE